MTPPDPAQAGSSKLWLRARMSPRTLVLLAFIILFSAVFNVGVAWTSAAFEALPPAPQRFISVPIGSGTVDIFLAEFRTPIATRRVIAKHTFAVGLGLRQFDHSHAWLFNMYDRQTPTADDPAFLVETASSRWGSVPEYARAMQDMLRNPAGSELAPINELRLNTFQNLSLRSNVPPPRFPVDDARGWPMRCLSCTIVIDGDKVLSDGAIDTVLLDGVPPANRTYPDDITRRLRAIPLRPIWTGMIFNTLLYAGVIWSTTAGLFAVRGWYRRRGQLCPSCRYDLRGQSQAGCPECGHGRE